MRDRNESEAVIDRLVSYLRPYVSCEDGDGDFNLKTFVEIIRERIGNDLEDVTPAQWRADHDVPEPAPYEDDGGAEDDDPRDYPGDDPDACTNPRGHEWEYTGTAYGGDDERYYGEGRCYCIHCGTDGDG